MLRVLKRPNLTVRHTAFPHQLDAFESLKDQPYAAIFHEQGLGKTKIGLDLVLFWLTEGIVDSVLIVVKKNLVTNWQDEIATHSHVQPRILNQDRMANFYALNSPTALYLIHYEAVVSERRRLSLFLQTRKVAVLLDEAHKIKNPAARVTVALHELAGGFERRVIMTGTPMANRPYDLWSQVKFLDHGKALGRNFREFKKTLDLTNDLNENTSRAAVFANALEETFKKIQPFTVRETKASAGLRLPDKTLRNCTCPLEARQAELYAKVRDELAAIIVQNGKPVFDDAEVILKRLLRLIQIASHPVLVDHAYAAIPGKLPILETLVRAAIDAQEKIIVWTSFTDNAERLGRYFAGYNAGIVHGGRTIGDRETALTAFKSDPACCLLVATPGAAKEGLTLTVANHAVFYDRSFSLDDYLQAQDRIHRISQERPCFVTNLIAKDTIDCWVDALLVAKNLAARLGQGDIDRQDYDAEADYAFGDMLNDVLGLNKET
ncbi:MAG: DEAD/DEAH box helicase [Aestuariivita sp.]|nr:DEAD/DEAH box helicase [Aestuariivita sp.]MCY4202909.1 DEAD/DEAH box helicase [Aestuariivita sp.]